MKSYVVIRSTLFYNDVAHFDAAWDVMLDQRKDQAGADDPAGVLTHVITAPTQHQARRIADALNAGKLELEPYIGHDRWTQLGPAGFQDPCQIVRSKIQPISTTPAE